MRAGRCGRFLLACLLLVCSLCGRAEPFAWGQTDVTRQALDWPTPDGPVRVELGAQNIGWGHTRIAVRFIRPDGHEETFLDEIASAPPQMRQDATLLVISFVAFPTGRAQGTRFDRWYRWHSALRSPEKLREQQTPVQAP